MNIYAQRFFPFLSSAFLTFSGTAALDARPALGIEITDAWIRWLPASVPSAGYMTLENHGSAAQALVGASSRIYGEITLHRSLKIEGMSGMAPVETLTLASKESVNFLSQGYHLMLTQPRRAIGAGERVPITLRFSSGQSVTVQFVVRGAIL